LNEILDKAGFDSFCETNCAPFYHEKLGRPSLAPGLYFRVMMIGFFEGLDSERGIAWRLADSLTLRQFLSIGLDERTPDHVTISRTRRLIDGETHQRVFNWVLERLAQSGLVKGKTTGVDSTTLEANAAMKSVVRRDTGESYSAYLKGLAEAEGIDAKGAAADTATIEETVIEAGLAVAELITAKTAEGNYEVHPGGVEEVVADKGDHSNDVAVGLQELGVRSYIAEPDRGPRNWRGKEAAKTAVYGNRRRIQGERGKRMQRQRGERIERNFAHQFDTGGLDRLYVRGIKNVHKKFLIQAAACNLALLLRSMYGAGKPKAAHNRTLAAIFAILAVLSAVEDYFLSWWSDLYDQPSTYVANYTFDGFASQLKNRAV
jgi:transposase